VGSLALLGVAGHGGLPAGHAVAFNADAALRVALAREVLASCARAAEEDGGGGGGGEGGGPPSSWEDMLVSYGSVLAAQAGEVDAAAAAAAQRSIAAGLRDSPQL
jgi:hypothetical protein